MKNIVKISESMFGMKDSFFKSVTTLKKNTPNKSVLEAFHSHFPTARNIEWSKENNGVEAIFSDHEFEKIGKFDNQGTLIEIRTNLKPDNLSDSMLEKLKKHGTLMNIIHIDNKIFGVTYELIIRDEWKVRHLFITDNEGNVVTHRNFDDLI